MTSTSYTFASNDFPTKKTKHKRNSASNSGSNHNSHHQNDGDSVDPTDDSGSLTYSAASSVHSGGSAAGESTDSSFADVMKVLDLQDTSELAAYMKKEGASSANDLRSKLAAKSNRHSAASVASSLNYSTDGESHLEGSQLLQTIAGQPSDSYALDGGSGNVRHDQQPIAAGDNLDILFAPAAPVDSYEKRKRDKKKARQLQKQQETARHTGTPKAKNSRHRSFEEEDAAYSSPRHQEQQYNSGSSSSTGRTPTRSPSSSSKQKHLQHQYHTDPASFGNKPPTPPPQPPRGMTEEEEDIWYAKWWMSCFPDSFKNLMPKR